MKLSLALLVMLAIGCIPTESKLSQEAELNAIDSPTKIIEVKPETPGVVLPALHAIASAQAGLYGSETSATSLRRDQRLHSDRFDILFDRSRIIISSRATGERTTFSVTDDAFLDSFQQADLTESERKLVAGVSTAFRHLTSHGDELIRFNLADSTEAAPILSVVRLKRPSPERRGVIFEVVEQLGTVQFLHNGLVLNPEHLQTRN